MAKFLIISGSSRKKSLNSALALWVQEILSDEDYESEVINFKHYPMPIYNGDLEAEQGIPEAATALEKKIKSASTLIFCSPEYNGFFPPVLKNALDWVSRVGLGCFSEKKAILFSASPGGLGGIRSLPHLRLQLSNLGCNVQSRQMAIPKAGEVLEKKDKATKEKIQVVLFGR